MIMVMVLTRLQTEMVEHGACTGNEFVWTCQSASEPEAYLLRGGMEEQANNTPGRATGSFQPFASSGLVGQLL